MFITEVDRILEAIMSYEEGGGFIPHFGLTYFNDTIDI